MTHIILCARPDNDGYINGSGDMRMLTRMLVAVATMAALAGSTHAAEQSVIRIATDGAYPPYIATDSAGGVYGLEADLVADLCRRMAARCEWVRQSFDGAIPGLQRGRFDAIVSSLSITAERRKAIDFSVPYFQGPTVFVLPDGSRYRAALGSSVQVTLDDLSEQERQVIERARVALKGATVGIERSSTHEVFLKKYFADSIKLRTYDAANDVFLDLLAGRVDMAVVGQGEMAPFLSANKSPARQPSPAGPSFKGGVLGQGVAVGLRKGNERLRHALDHAIQDANRDGTIRKLGLKWFGFDGSPALAAGPGH